MSRILFDARSIVEKNGGVSRVAERVLTHIRATRPDAEIVTITTGFIDSRVTTDGVHSLHIKRPNKLWSLACLVGITSLDRVAVKMSGRPFDELILPNVGFVGTPNIPYTVIVHDLSFLIEPKWFPWKMRLWHRAVGASRLIRNAKNIWCVSETTARDVVRLLGVEKEKITVLLPDVLTRVGAVPRDRPDQNGVTPDSGRSRGTAPTLVSGHRYVLAFDGNNPRKDISTAIAAVERVREDERFKNLQLIVIGTLRPTPYALPRWMICTTPTDTELDTLYRGATCLLYPSWYEGFGLPLHEAARFNVPILASAHGSLPETAPPGTILINPAKPHLWAEALRNVLERGFVKQ